MLTFVFYCRCKFFVQTWPGLADGLCEKLVLAAEVVRRVLEGG